MLSIPEYFTGQTVFLTGATGSVGSVFLEKLLRDCNGVKKVYLLVRPKNGVSAEDRIHSFLQLPLFSKLEKDDFKKIHAMNGDVTLDKLGLSVEDYKLLTSEVTLVFHAAAKVFFNASLKSAVTSNLIGTRWILELCHKMAKLESLIYVSTAYCNCTLKETRERLYPTEFSPEEIIEIVEKSTVEELEKSTRRLIGDHPNTYTFSKQLAEQLLNEGKGHIKLAIVRPSIVIGTWQEPFPGWIDGATGATGFIAGAGAGCFRTTQVAPNKVADLIPSDILVNALLAAAWNLALSENSALQIFHVTSGLSNPITWGQYTEYINDAIKKHPMKKILWYPNAKARNSKWRNAVAFQLFQLWPSYVLDTMRVLFSGKRKESLVAIQNKFVRGMFHTRYFCVQQWQFHTINMENLANSLSSKDQEKFNTSMLKVDWQLHLENCVLGVRENFHKDPPSTLPESRSNLKIWKAVHIGAQVIFFFWLAYLMTYIFSDGFTSLALSALAMSFLHWI